MEQPDPIFVLATVEGMNSSSIALTAVEQTSTQWDLLALEFRRAMPIKSIVARFVVDTATFGYPEDQ